MATLLLHLDPDVYHWLERTAQATGCSTETIVQGFLLDHMNAMCTLRGDQEGLRALNEARERMGVEYTSLIPPAALQRN